MWLIIVQSGLMWSDDMEINLSDAFIYVGVSASFSTQL